MRKLTDQYPEFTAWLTSIANNAVIEKIASEYGTESNDCLASFLNDIDESGDIEIGHQHTAHKKTIIGSFPDLAS